MRHAVAGSRRIASARTSFHGVSGWLVASTLVLAAVSPAAAASGSPIGELIGASDEPTIVSPEGRAGGLRLSGVATDLDAADGVETRVFIDGEQRAVGVADPTDGSFAVLLPLAPGTYTVCATALNVGPGTDSNLGCIDAIVLRHGPAPSEAWLDDGSGVLLGGLEVASVSHPSVAAAGCVDPSVWGHRPDDIAFAFVVEGVDGHRVASGAVAAEEYSDGDQACAWTTWHVDEELHAGVPYTIHAQLVIGEAQPGPWLDGASFYGYRAPAEPALVSPADGAESSPTPTVAVRLEPIGNATAAIIQILDARTGTVVAEGATDTLDHAGTVVWSPSDSLPPGSYHWRALAWDKISQSEWTDSGRFTVVAPPSAPVVVATASPRLAASVTWVHVDDSGDPVLDYTVTAEPGGHSVTVVPDGGHLVTAEMVGLEPGAYDLRVTARNRVGSGAPSPVRTVVVDPPVALAPTNLAATTSGTSATISWEPPTDSGGVPLTSYRVVVVGHGTSTVPVSQTTLVLGDLSYGEWYTALVSASTERGYGEPARVEFRPITVPDPPTDLSVRLGDSELVVSWAPPSFDGGSPISSYVITAQPGGVSMPADTATVRFGGLDNGTAYTFTVAALNDAGTGASSLTTDPRTPVSQGLDSDDDGLPDILEERAGSNPLLADSDLDGLGDAFEVLELTSLTSPLAVDSDGDGIMDPADDEDDDGRPNSAELAAGTRPADRDSDDDGLDDFGEVSTGTDPLTADTDDDALNDGDELRLGLDPLVADSDGDGTGDAATPATVEVTGDGFAAGLRGTAARLAEIRVEQRASTGVVGAVTDSVTVTEVEMPGGASTDLGDSTITFDIPASHDATAEFAAFAWNAADGGWAPSAATAVTDPEARTVTIESPQLGVAYTVVDLDEWRASARECDLAWQGEARLDVEVVMDALPSAYGNDPTGERFAAVTRVLETLDPGDSARLRTYGVQEIDFGYGSSIVPLFTHGPPAAGSGTSVDRVISQLETLSGHPISSPSTSMDSLADWLGPEYAETALGGLGLGSPTIGTNPYLPAGGQAQSLQCRTPAVVLVVDGYLEPPSIGMDLPNGYVPLKERIDTPIHILDIGPGGETADWLRTLAGQTGGSYTHIATAEPSPSWDRSLSVGAHGTTDDTDGDGDGLSDWIEIVGARAAATLGVVGDHTKRLFYTDPADPDTDDDGLSDGEEIGRRVEAPTLELWSAPIPIPVYRIVSDPTEPDGDLDGLSDTEEVDAELNPLDDDIDGDGLLDGAEVQWGTDLYSQNTDIDDYDDAFEVAHHADGYDPTVENPSIDQETYAYEFYLGAFCGDVDVCRRATIPWLLGNITSGLLVYGDVRDVLWSVYEGNLAATALITAGLVPGAGDAAEAVGKIVRALPDMGRAAAHAARELLYTLTDDTGSFITAIRLLEPELVTRLEDAGMESGAMARLLRDNDPDRLKLIVMNPRVTLGADYDLIGRAPGYMDSGGDGERFLRGMLGQDVDVRPSPAWIGGSRPAFCLGCRYPDAVVTTAVGKVSYESKVGFVRGGFAARQAAKDLALLAAGDARFVEWHFFASSVTGRIGLSSSLLDKLMESPLIRIVIHLPE